MRRWCSRICDTNREPAKLHMRSKLKYGKERNTSPESPSIHSTMSEKSLQNVQGRHSFSKIKSLPGKGIHSATVFKIPTRGCPNVVRHVVNVDEETPTRRDSKIKFAEVVVAVRVSTSSLSARCDRGHPQPATTMSVLSLHSVASVRL